MLDQLLARADWDGFPARRNGLGATREAARPRPRRATSNGPARSAPRPPMCGSAPTVRSRFSRVRRRWVRAWRRRIRQLVAEVLELDAVAYPGRPGRHRPGERRRQRRLALGVHRRLGDRRWPAARCSTKGRLSPPTRSKPRRPTSSTRGGRFRIAGTDRARSVCSSSRRAQPRRAHPRLRDRDAVRPVMAEWRAGLRGRDRLRYRRGRGRALHQRRRHRPHHQSHDRGGADPRRHRAGRRPGAVRAASSTTRRAASCSPAR